MNIEESLSTVVHRWDDGKMSLEKEFLGDESLIHLCLNGEKITSLLASNCDLKELLCGHYYTEYDLVIPTAKPNISIEKNSTGISVNLLNEKVELNSKRNNIVVSSCGACDQNELSDLIDRTPTVSNPTELYSIPQLILLLDQMRGEQVEFSKNGGVHGAGLLFNNGTFDVKEDIGRHNAVDKVIGAAFLSGTTQSIRAMFLSGRCGWDIVMKAAKSNIPVIVSVGAASSLAAKTARAANITLVSFVRHGKSVVIGPVDGRFHTKD